MTTKVTIRKTNETKSFIVAWCGWQRVQKTSSELAWEVLDGRDLCASAKDNREGDSEWINWTEVLMRLYVQQKGLAARFSWAGVDFEFDDFCQKLDIYVSSTLQKRLTTEPLWDKPFDLEKTYTKAKAAANKSKTPDLPPCPF